MPPPDTFVPEDQSAFLSFLDWITGGGRAVRSALSGDMGRLGRNVTDTLLDIPDAFIPGDVFKKRATKPGDDADFADLLTGMDDGPLKKIAGAAGNVLTDPLTYVPGAALMKGAKGLGAAAENIPGVAKGLETLRKVTNNQRLSAPIRETITAAQGKSAATQKNWAIHAEEVLSKHDPKTRALVSDVIENTTGATPGDFKLLDPSHAPVSRYAENTQQIADAIKRAKLHPDYTPAADQAIKDYLSASHGMYAQIGKLNAWDMPTEMVRNKATNQLATQEEAKALGWTRPDAMDPEQWKGPAIAHEPFNPEMMSPRDYLMRIIESKDTAGKLVNPLRERHLQSAPDLVNFLNDPANKVTRYERDALVRFAGRIPAQGKVARKQELGKAVVGPDFKSGHRHDQIDFDKDVAASKQFSDALDDHVATGRMTDEESTTLRDLYTGFGDTGPKDAISKALDTGNRYFKQAAVYGIGIPRIASIIRNRFSTGLQVLGAPGSNAKQTLSQFKNFATDVWSSAVHDGLGLKLPKDKMRQYLDTLDSALKGSHGRIENAVAALRKGTNTITHRLADALELGVIDSGFVTGEELAKDIAESKTRKFAQFPARWFQGTEQRARLGLFLDKVEDGATSSAQAAEKIKTARQAAEETSNTLYNYEYLSKANKNARRWLPFAQFTFQAVPREGAKLLKNPWAIPAVAQLYGTDEDSVVPQWMAEQAHVPMGNDSYLSGFGEPMGALSKIPNLTGGHAGDEVRKVMANMQPFAKTAFAAASGHDLYSDQPFGSYDRLPLDDKGSDAGSLYRIAEGTGLIQPLATPMNMLDTLLGESPDRTTGARVAQTFVGPHVRTIDVEKTRKQELEKELHGKRGVAEYTRLYAQDSATPEVDSLINELNAIEKARKQKAAQAAAASVR